MPMSNTQNKAKAANLELTAPKARAGQSEAPKERKAQHTLQPDDLAQNSVARAD